MFVSFKSIESSFFVIYSYVDLTIGQGWNASSFLVALVFCPVVPTECRFLFIILARKGTVRVFNFLVLQKHNTMSSSSV